MIDAVDNRLSHIANGVIHSDAGEDLALRLLALHEGIAAIIGEFGPTAAAVETTLANKNPASTLKLGMARGAALLTAARLDVPVREYLPMIVKKAVVGSGHADKRQVETMVRRLLPGTQIAASDAADALAVAICHAHNKETTTRWNEARLRAQQSTKAERATTAGRTQSGRPLVTS